VIKPRRAPLEEARNDGNMGLPRHLGQPGRGGSGNGLGQIEEADILALAKILRAEKLRQADNVRAHPRSLFNLLDGRGEIGLGVGPHAHLHEPHVVFACIPHHSPGEPPKQSCLAMQQGQPRRAGLASEPLDRCGRYSGMIRTAAAIVVVHSPFLSPTADWVMLLVRTILLEMR